MSLLSILGMALGVATLISVMAVMSGFSSKLLRNILAMNGHITVHCKNSDYHKVMNEIEGTREILYAVPVVEGQAMVKSKAGATGVIVRGMEMQDITHKLSQYTVSEHTSEIGEGIIIGSGLADSLDVQYGDEVTVISSADFFTIIGATPRTQKYKVTGVFNVGMYEYDSAFAYIPLKNAQSLFGYSRNNVRYIEVGLDDASLSSNVAELLTSKTGMQVEDWKVQQSQYFHALKLEQDAMFFVLMLIVIVAAFSIVSGIYVLVHEKKRAVAVMRTMGLGKFAVARVFCICGLYIGTIGTSIGCIIGVLVALNMEKISDFLGMFGNSALFESVAYCLEGMSSKMVLLDIVQVASLSLSISLIATLPAALRAAAQNPVDILKYE